MKHSESIIESAFNGLGNIDPIRTEAVAELLDKYNLRWDVEKVSLVSADTTLESGFYGVRRVGTNQIFSAVGEGYTPFQNSELAELIIRVADKTDYTIHAGGSFNDGGRIYLQLDTHNNITNLGENKTTVKGYASAINSHDGTTSLKWGAVNFTICCKNTFAAASRKLQNSIRHTSNMKVKVEASIKQLMGVVEVEKSIFESFIKLSEIKVTPKIIASIVKGITEVDITLNKATAADEYSSYSINRTEELLGSISKEMKQKGETLWGLFSGVTHYTSHVSPVNKKKTNARAESKYTGSASKIDNDAYALVMAEMTN